MDKVIAGFIFLSPGAGDGVYTQIDMPGMLMKVAGVSNYSAAVEKAKAMGIGFICMEGNINFYRHVGFDLASKLNIHYHCEPKDSEVPYFLAQELIPCYLNEIEATYTPSKGYFVAEENPEDFAKYEAEFPYKEKLVLPGQLG